STGKSVWIAEVKDIAGLVGKDEVIYPQCLVGERGFTGTLRYKLTLAGISQEVLLETAVPSAADMGFAAGKDEDLAIEVWSQMLDSPPATTQPEILTPGEEDQHVDFGTMNLGRGSAFPLEADSPSGVATLAKSVPVTKEYVQVQAMQFLVERADYRAI